MFNYEINVKTLTYLQKINVILYLHIFDGKGTALMKYS